MHYIILNKDFGLEDGREPPGIPERRTLSGDAGRTNPAEGTGK
jgi:hypothetical protein